MGCKTKATTLLAAVLVSIGLGLPAQEAFADGMSSRLKFKCVDLEDVPKNLHVALADVFAPMPGGESTQVCLSPVIRHGRHQFQVAAAARNEVWCAPTGECQTWVLGRVGEGAFTTFAPVIGLSTKKGVGLRRGAAGSPENLEIVFTGGTYRWVPSSKQFAFVISSPGTDLTITN